MRIDEIRELNDTGLAEEVEASYKELMNLRIRSATKQLTNTSQLGAARKNLARLLTVMRERELQRV